MSLIDQDEIVMCHRQFIEALDRSLKNIMQNTHSFGGKAFLFADDFWKIILVVWSGSRAQIVNACVKSSFLYDRFNIARASENMRLQVLLQDTAPSEEPIELLQFLLKVGEE